MKEAEFLRLIRGETRGLLAGVLRSILWVAASLYALGVKIRNLAFDQGWKRIERVEVPVVSVGNLTLGGTGKTPMVEWVARWFRSRGARVGLLSRGYGQVEGLNDEGRVLEDNLPDCPHLQGSDRVLLARTAIEELESQVLILDDGFQHRRLARDLDIVLLDVLEPFGTGRIFPRGLLREPIRSLRRADIVVLSRADLIDVPTRDAIRAEAERECGPLRWVSASHAPQSLIDADGRSFSLSDLQGARVVAFCGIGNPEGFRRTLAKIGVKPLGFRTFPDHHPYGRTDVDDLSRWVRDLGADLALTTQKDLVKLRTPNLGPVPLRALRIGLKILDGEAILDEALGSLWRSE